MRPPPPPPPIAFVENTRKIQGPVLHVTVGSPSSYPAIPLWCICPVGYLYSGALLLWQKLLAPINVAQKLVIGVLRHRQ